MGEDYSNVSCDCSDECAEEAIIVCSSANSLQCLPYGGELDSDGTESPLPNAVADKAVPYGNPIYPHKPCSSLLEQRREKVLALSRKSEELGEKVEKIYCWLKHKTIEGERESPQYFTTTTSQQSQIPEAKTIENLPVQEPESATQQRMRETGGTILRLVAALSLNSDEVSNLVSCLEEYKKAAADWAREVFGFERSLKTLRCALAECKQSQHFFEDYYEHRKCAQAKKKRRAKCSWDIFSDYFIKLDQRFLQSFKDLGRTPASSQPTPLLNVHAVARLLAILKAFAHCRENNIRFDEFLKLIVPEEQKRYSMPFKRTYRRKKQKSVSYYPDAAESEYLLTLQGAPLKQELERLCRMLLEAGESGEQSKEEKELAEQMISIANANASVKKVIIERMKNYKKSCSKGKYNNSLQRCHNLELKRKKEEGTPSYFCSTEDSDKLTVQRVASPYTGTY